MKTVNAQLQVGAPAENFYVDQAVQRSREHANRYREERSAVPGLTDAIRSQLTEARLQALLEEHRRSLCGHFTAAEFLSLLDCYQGEVFDPFGVEDMAGALVDHAPELEPLARKVASLSTGSRYALADLIEQAWYRCPAEGKSHESIARELGVTLT